MSWWQKRLLSPPPPPPPLPPPLPPLPPLLLFLDSSSSSHPAPLPPPLPPPLLLFLLLFSSSSLFHLFLFLLFLLLLLLFPLMLPLFLSLFLLPLLIFNVPINCFCVLLAQLGLPGIGQLFVGDSQLLRVGTEIRAPQPNSEWTGGPLFLLPIKCNNISWANDGNRTEGSPVRSSIIRVICYSLVWLQTDIGRHEVPLPSIEYSAVYRPIRFEEIVFLCLIG